MTATSTENLPIDSIICGDNCEVMRTLPSESIDLVVTSPPYDNLRTYGGNSWDFEGVAQQLWRVIKPGGVVVWVVADATINGSETGTSFRQALRFIEIGFRLHDTMIYEKAGCSLPSDNRYLASFEFMFVFSKGAPVAYNLIEDRENRFKRWGGGVVVREQNGEFTHRATKEHRDIGRRFNIWRYVNGKGYSTEDLFAHRHPAIFPESLARDHILSWSNENDIVLDPFSGSGTTAKMAKHNGRRFIGIEINPEYVEIANKRLQQGVLF
tara:strand:- start:9540 stop:10343 length:804 start_codon:yes stop_codon:yes gene_type:complete